MDLLLIVAIGAGGVRSIGINLVEMDWVVVTLAMLIVDGLLLTTVRVAVITGFRIVCVVCGVDVTIGPFS